MLSRNGYDLKCIFFNSVIPNSACFSKKKNPVILKWFKKRMCLRIDAVDVAKKKCQIGGIVPSTFS